MTVKKLVIAALVTVILFIVWFYTRHPLGVTAQIRGHVFTLDVAVTPQEKEQGLGYRQRLDENRGMLFIYDHQEQYSFWMKGMNFPLDILWIRGKEIVDISKHVSTGPPYPHITPALPVDKVLEVNAGTVDKYGIRVGDHVTVQF